MSNEFTFEGTPVSSPGTLIQRQLAMALQPDCEPTLTEDELDLLLLTNLTVDKNGVAPGSAGYITTYDLNNAIVDGWTTKAAKVAGNYTFKDESLTLNREQVIKQCLQMASNYAQSVISSLPLDNVLIRRRIVETQMADYEYD